MLFFFSVKFYCVAFFNTMICDSSCINMQRYGKHSVLFCIYLLQPLLESLGILLTWSQKLHSHLDIAVAFSSKLPLRTSSSETVTQSSRQTDLPLPILSSICLLSLWTPARRQWSTAVFQMTSKLNRIFHLAFGRGLSSYKCSCRFAKD